MADGLLTGARGERLSRSFADITNELEHAHEVSVDGQDGQRTRTDRRRMLARSPVSLTAALVDQRTFRSSAALTIIRLD